MTRRFAHDGTVDPISHPTTSPTDLLHFVHGAFFFPSSQAKVRHCPASATNPTWHKATDSLVGTEAYGREGDDSSVWSVKFHSTRFDEFLFATGGCKKWLIASKDQVIGDWCVAERFFFPSCGFSRQRKLNATWF